MLQVNAEDAACALQLRIKVRVEHPLLLAELLDRLVFAKALDFTLGEDFPVRFAGPAGGGKRLRVLAFANADLVDVLAEADIGRPFSHPYAACDKKYRHKRKSPARRPGIE